MQGVERGLEAGVERAGRGGPMVGKTAEVSAGRRNRAAGWWEVEGGECQQRPQRRWEQEGECLGASRRRRTPQPARAWGVKRRRSSGWEGTAGWWPQWVESWAFHPRVPLPVKGTFLGGRFLPGPGLGVCDRQPTPVSPIDVSLSLPPSYPSIVSKDQ